MYVYKVIENSSQNIILWSYGGVHACARASVCPSLERGVAGCYLSGLSGE